MVFADQVNIDTTQINVTPPWRTTISINGIPIEFKIDTGADVSVIRDDMRKEFFRKVLLQKEGPNGLRAVGNLSIPVEGTIHVVMERKEKNAKKKCTWYQELGNHSLVDQP